jgi:folate-binding Fe-S cluster repair protein YgfZ
MTNTMDAATGTLKWSVIEARGDDAETFLQGQLSQDLTSLDGWGAWTLVLAPDSVVVTAAFATRVDGGIDLVVPRELADVTASRLRRFLLRTKCTLNAREVDDGPYDTVDALIEARWPGANEFAKALTPHSFGRHFVDATISFQKGCFTGQELVGRLDARGSSVPWRFVRVVGPSAEAIDAILHSKGPEGPQGLTSWRDRDRDVEGLGVAHRTLIGADGLEGVTVEEIE